MSRPAHTERVSLADLAAELGPQAPTLNEGWDVADLLAHIILRESRPDLALGIMVPQLSGRLEGATEDLARTSFTSLVEKVRSGPPSWSPTRIPAVDNAVNLLEFFVHHEDIRRANGMGPRGADADLDSALIDRMRQSGRFWFRNALTGVTLAPVGDVAFQVKPTTATGLVTIAGNIQEIVLYGFGRRSVAQVELLGPQAAVEALKESTLSP